jgi:hypothetical protein
MSVTIGLLRQGGPGGHRAFRTALSVRRQAASEGV